MAFNSVIYLAIVVFSYDVSVKAAPQFFGGVQNVPGGLRTQQAGYQAGPAWGSLSQSHDSRGFSSPITYSGGINAYSPAGSGVGGSLAVQPGIGGQGTLRGQIGHQMGNHNTNVFAQHDRILNRNLRPIGPETNSVGINYSHNNGASAFISGSRTNGQPSQGTIGGSYPIYTNKNGGISATGQTTFAHGMKPVPQVGIQGSFRF